MLLLAVQGREPVEDLPEVGIFRSDFLGELHRGIPFPTSCKKAYKTDTIYITNAYMHACSLSHWALWLNL